MRMILSAATLAIAAAAMPAAAQQITVRYDDLDLATPQGQQTLDHRIDTAARELCGLERVYTGTRVRSREARKCYASSQASLRKQVASLTAARRTGG